MRSIVSAVVAVSALLITGVIGGSPARAGCSSGGTVSDINDCVPGGRSPSSRVDCRMEFSVSPVPPADIKGLPTMKVTCYDNGNMCSVSHTPCLDDSECPGAETCSVPCDQDSHPGQCTFNVGVCLNVSDSRLAKCTPGQTDELTVERPSARASRRADKNPFARDNRRNLTDSVDALVPTAAADVCTEERAIVVPLRKGVKKGKVVVKARSADSASSVRDLDLLRLSCLPNPNLDSLPISTCRQITSAAELIGGATAVGRVGDWLLENDRIRVIIRDVDRAFSFTLTQGGHIVDADVVRDPSICSVSGGSCSVDGDCPSGETCIPEGRDNFIGVAPLINISSTDQPITIGCTSVDDGDPLRDAAILTTSGTDDLWDPVNPWVAIKSFSSALSVPPKAVDMDLPVRIDNHYSLAKGDNFVKIETVVWNDAAPGTCATPPANFGNACSVDTDCDDPPSSNNGQCGTLSLYIGDFLNGGGQVDEVGPGLGYGNIPIRLGGDLAAANPELSLDWISFIGVGEASGVSYGLIPELFNLTGAFSDSGVTVPVYAQQLVGLLLASGGSKPPGVLVIPPGDSNSFVRYFAVGGEGGAGQIADARNKIFSVKTGYIQGTVTANGVPQDGARVTVVRRPGDRNGQLGLVDAFETSNGGFYQGTLPKGFYSVMVKAPGIGYSSAADQNGIRIGGRTTVVDFNLTTEAATLKVIATDPVSAAPLVLPLPVKVSVVGLRADEPTITEVTALGNPSGQVLGTDIGNKVAELPFGLAAVGFAGPSGVLGGDPSDPFKLPPGDYQVVVSHGPEYSVFKQNVTLTGGAPTTINASLVPVVSTPGFISQDAHVHMINSPDSWVTKKQRILTMLGEGVDHFVASDHDFVTDLSGDIAALGAAGLIQFSISEEITTFDMGHYGAYPLTRDPTSVTGGAIDWGGGPGYPSGGSYGLTPEQIILAARADLGAKVVQVNHFYSFFEFAGIDTRTIPPVSSSDGSLLRMDPAATNLFTSEMDALEVWIENTRAQNDRFLGENLGDWLNLLNGFDSTNPEMRFTGTADSDTHHTTVIQAAGPRSFVASSTDDPGLISRTEIANSVIDGRVIGTNGPFVRVTVDGDVQSAGLDLGSSLLAKTTTGTVNVNIHIESPTWAEYDRIQIYANAVPSCSTLPHDFLLGQKALCNTTPTVTLFKGFNFAVSTVAVNGDSRLQTDVTRTLNVGSTDTWIMVVVRGTDGNSKPLFPMSPLDIYGKTCSLDPCKECRFNSDCPGGANTCIDANTSRDDLADGNLGECGVLSLAFTNPLFVDADGSGDYKGVPFP